LEKLVKKEGAHLSQTPASKFKRFFKEWILPFGIEALVIVLLIKFVFFFAFVPTESMVPTIAAKSWLFSWRVYNTENLERGDVVVFDNEEVGKTLIKRLIGLPGETVEIINGEIYIDGELLEEKYVINHSYETGRFEVPEGCYLFLGDNRSGSADARYWYNPYIPAEAIQGRAVFTVIPFRNFGVLR